MHYLEVGSSGPNTCSNQVDLTKPKKSRQYCIKLFIYYFHYILVQKHKIYSILVHDNTLDIVINMIIFS